MMYANEMIEARHTPELRSMSDKAKGDAVRVLIHRLYELKGIEPLERDVNIAAEDIVIETRRRYPAITTGEVSLAFKYGLAENFGKDTRLVVSNFLLWLERYMTHPDRLDAVNLANKAARMQNTALIESADRDTRHAEFVQDAPRKEWENYKASGSLEHILVDGYAAAVYDALVERGKINPTESTRAAALAQARAELERESRVRGRSIAYYLNDTNETMRTKRILLEAYFKSLRVRGIELS